MTDQRAANTTIAEAVIGLDSSTLSVSLFGNELRREGPLPVAAAAVLVAVGYYLGSKLGLALTLPPSPVAVLWPPNSILLAALLLSPYRTWWLLLLSVLPAHWAAQWHSGVPAAMVGCWFVSNCCEALIGASCIRGMLGKIVRFDSVRAIATFCFFGVVLGPFLSSFLDAGFVRLNQWGEGTYWNIWRIRFTSNILAALTITPTIVTWWTLLTSDRRPLRLRRKLEIVALGLGVLVTSFSVYVFYHAGPNANAVLLYAEVPFLLWATLRFGPVGASTAMLVTTLLAIWGAAHGAGPFLGGTPEENALQMQLFLTLATAPMLLLGAAVRERGQAEERFTKAFMLCPDPMLICRRADACVIAANMRAHEVLGYALEQATRQPISDLGIFASTHDRDRLREAIHGELPFRELELHLQKRSGEMLHALVSADVAEIAEEDCLIVVLRDVTDRKRAEEAVENLAHASRLAVVGELTATIAHELCQPLGAILTNADAADVILTTNPGRTSELKAIVADIRADDNRASEVIRRIWALLKREEMQMQPLDLNKVASDVLLLVRRDARRRGIGLRTEFAADLPVVLGEMVHLQQVLLNLIINGMDAMRDTPIYLRRLTVRTARKNGEAELSVEDCGCGIASEDMSRLFDSFFTTKKDGIGLGLAIARRIVEAHRGQIWAENGLHGGAIFHVALPALARKA